MKKIFRLLTIAMVGFALTACQYDDSGIWDALNDLQEQVDQNEQDIATLSALLDAQQSGKTITSTDYTSEGVVITFSDGTSVTIKNGKDGANGADGEDGKDGKDGENGENGKDGKDGENGENGKDGKDGDSFFVSIEESDTTVTITLADGRVITLPKATEGGNEEGGSGEEELGYELRVLSFEDGTEKFAPYAITGYDSATDSYYDHTVTVWSDLIDTPEYGGPLTYGDMGYMGEMRGCDYNWYDEGNTFLASEFPVNYGSKVYWGGGHVVSDYASTDYATYGTYEHQMTVYGTEGAGGHNGSPNFGIHYGYIDGSDYNMTEVLPYFYFADGEARVIDHLWVNNSCYAISCYADGNSLTAGIGENDYVKVVATGYDADGNSTTAEFYLCNGPEHFVTEWAQWDLSSLGAVVKVEFNILGSSDNGYGFSQPSYFAYDDVAVRFEK